ncbi:terpene cyclase [Streptomyces sp. WA1-19]|uniref:terpene synthase family protein n=1 Tax=unclassified Streptomyces TaxID=2593676 RepID=UPI001D03A58F|nr:MULTISPECIES: terpene cyclase [unclassified Streptomyces]UDF08786.1 terpene cyclase [Streptomyces sp. WA1-19]UYX97644.1 terpene cyclase [Streptomyces sp. BI87]
MSEVVGGDRLGRFLAGGRSVGDGGRCAGGVGGLGLASVGVVLGGGRGHETGPGSVLFLLLRDIALGGSGACVVGAVVEGAGGRHQVAWQRRRGAAGLGHRSCFGHQVQQVDAGVAVVISGGAPLVPRLGGVATLGDGVDHAVGVEGAGRLGGARRAAAGDGGASLFLLHAGVPGVLPPAVASLADLWQRTASGASAHWRRRFIQHLEDCLLTATVWEGGNRIRGIVPDEATYIENRRHTGAIYVCMDLIDIVEHLDVPEELYDSPEFTAALNAACNVVCWTNDVYSLDKERSLGEVHNLAYLAEYHRGLDRETALAQVCAETSAETELFLAAEESLLAAYPGRTALLTPYLSGMRTWIRGNLDWSRRTKRYQTATEPQVLPAEYIERTLIGADR